MAEEFLTPLTTSVLGKILEPQYDGSIGRAAAWADGYAHTEEGAFSYQWHWIDTSDDPPSYCNVYYHRDCSEGGCVVQAIANQTEILRECIADIHGGILKLDTNLTCSYSLKWVTHFLGDVAQPLHNSGIAAGGNRINVTFGDRSTELHAVWDGDIIHADAEVERFSSSSLDPFPASLVEKIGKDDFFEPTRGWLACTEPSTPLICALEWARDSNAWTCDYVYSQKFNDSDLLTSGYAEGAYPIVELQVSKAALRLATWLNRLVSGAFDHEGDIVLQTRLV